MRRAGDGVTLPISILTPGDMPRYDSALFWFRRDLRDYDNAGLAFALEAAARVFCVFVFDREILDALPSRYDRRVEFILRSVAELAAALAGNGGGLTVLHGVASDEIPVLARQLAVDAVFVNRDYEPQAVARDAKTSASLQEAGIGFHAYKDQVIFETAEVLSQSRTPYTVFTPYKDAWLKRLTDEHLAPCNPPMARGRLAKPLTATALPSLLDIGFEPTNIAGLLPAGMSGAQILFSEFRSRMADYREARNYPAAKGVSYLSVHLRFGTISIRELARAVRSERSPGGDTWLSELIWRDFYFQILHHFPYVVSGAFKREFDALPWENDELLFAAWCNARTGYPIVDAAMRQLDQTGYMHNRLRMVVASFLSKDLLVDWRWGEKYFADKLNDYDLAANNGGWQWAASTGCDAQPYFRVFNPVTQSQTYDPEGRFIRTYVPELTRVPAKYIHAPWTMPQCEQEEAGVRIGEHYPKPIVDHAKAREKALALYSAIKGSARASAAARR
jgi:deoxyribodipyrimidine photo-lyase